MSERMSKDGPVGWSEAVAHCRAQWEAGCGLSRAEVPASTAAAVAAMAQEVWISDPWRFTRASEWLRLEGLAPSPIFVSLVDADSWSRGVIIVLPPAGGEPRAMGGALEVEPPGAGVLLVFYPVVPAAGRETVPGGGCEANEATAQVPTAVAMNAGRTGADALATREELLACITVLRMLSLVPLAEGIPFRKRFVNRNGSEAFVTWPHASPMDAD